MSRRNYRKGANRPGQRRQPWQSNMKTVALDFGKTHRPATYEDLEPEEAKKRKLRWANATSKKHIPLPVPKVEKKDD